MIFCNSIEQHTTHTLHSMCGFYTKSKNNLYNGCKIFSSKVEMNYWGVVRLNMALYRMITAAQRDVSHQRKCNRLMPCVNVVTRYLFENKLFALQVERQLQQQNTRI